MGRLPAREGAPDEMEYGRGRKAKAVTYNHRTRGAFFLHL